MSDSVVVSTVPPCDLHLSEGQIVPAVYDAALNFGPWANVCEEHFQMYGVGLGTGRGQRLILRGSAAEAALPPKRTKLTGEESWEEMEEIVGDGDIADFI